MDKKAVEKFFDKCAPWWDDNMVRKENIISQILDNSGVKEGVDVLDVACGTGVLFGDYLSRGVRSVTGIDISSKMAEIARSKFDEVRVVCGDVETYEFDKQFDVVEVYNAFPHFESPQRLVGALAKLVKKGGRLSVAHSMSRQKLKEHHGGLVGTVAIDLIDERELAKIFEEYFDVDVIVSNDEMYQVAGTRR